MGFDENPFFPDGDEDACEQANQGTQGAGVSPSPATFTKSHAGAAVPTDHLSSNRDLPDHAVISAKLEAIHPDGTGTISIDGRQTAPARFVFVPKAEDIGCNIAVMFEQNDPSRPLIIGRHWVPGRADPLPDTRPEDSIRLEADRDITLKCGKASLTLTRAGKIILHGTYVSSRSTGANRIKGGSVGIN